MIRILLLITLLAAPGALFADTVYLKTGKVLKGRITDEAGGSVTLETGNTSKVIPGEKIKKIVREEAAAPQRPAGLQPPAPAPASAASPAAPAAKSKPRDAARALVLAGLYADAVAAYNPLAKGSQDAALAAEYAFALALAGYTDLALAHLDRAFLADPTHPEVLFYASAVFDGLGMTMVAQELYRPPPAWLPANPPKVTSLERPAGDYNSLLAAANQFMTSQRFAEAAAYFAVIVRASPNEQLPWSGYAIALEKLGAFKAAAKAVEKDIKLGRNEDPETLALLKEHKAELEAEPPVAYNPAPKLNEMLKGRYLSFFGLSYNRTETDSIFNLQTRVGKYLTNRVDVGADLGFTTGYEASDYNGLSFGASWRYNKPLPVAMPLNLTAGVKLAYEPGPENNFAMVLSPGLSYVLASGALDFYLDLSLTGPNKGTRTLSLGYTVYFGDAEK